jgi:site-specific recombinase XerD
MIQRRAKSAGVTTRVGNHTFRATGITAYLKNGGTLERAAQMANHASWGVARLSETSGCGKLNRNRRYRDDGR